jgi:hypothetical protein
MSLLQNCSLRDISKLEFDGWPHFDEAFVLLWRL